MSDKDLTKVNTGRSPSVFYTLNGKTMSLQGWGVELGVKWKTLWARIKSGASVEVALQPEMPRVILPRNPKKTIEKTCEGCGKKFVIPMCRDHREHSCSSECKEVVRLAKSDALKKSRTRSCDCCGTLFVAKKSQTDIDGHGRFCSHPCAMLAHTKRLLNSPQAQARRLLAWKESFSAGRIVFLSGKDNPRWRGGPSASRDRAQKDGRRAKYVQAYRQKNPEKVREFGLRRKSRKYGRLPKGTIARIGASQKWKCVVCRVSIIGNYHVDHVRPLALGGIHEPLNIQLLCPACNVRKSSKDPIDFMQSRGFLL